MSKTLAYNLSLVVLIILENLFLLVFHPYHITNQAVNSAGYFLVSVSIGLVVLVKFYNKPVITVAGPPPLKRKLLVILLGTACLLTLNGVTISVMKRVDADNFADIIPAIRLTVKSLLAGGYPYGATVLAPIHIPRVSNYLPMHWLPYTIAEYFRFDYRTITFVVWSLGASVIMYRSARIKDLWIQIITPALISFSYIMLFYQQPYLIAGTVELLVAGYYMLLIAGLHQKNAILTGIIIGTCMLSRYYIILWLPLWAFVQFISGNRRALIKTCVTVAVTLSVLYVIPFLSKDWSVFYRSVKDYETLPYFEWLHMDDSGTPLHLFSGVGFAYLFFDKYKHGELVEGYHLFKNLFYLSVAFSVVIMGIWYWLKRNKIDTRIFLLASFKIYLSVFLAFVLVPYIYLMIPASFISIAIFTEQARYKV